MNRSDVLVERCPSGIPGFDVVCGGGLVKNSVNVILGGPGAGKTIFLLQFLYNGATKYKDPGLYISFEADIEEIYKDARIFGWDLQKLDANDQCKFLRIQPDADVAELKRELTKMIAKYQIRRICFDPITMFDITENNSGRVRRIVFDLVSLLKRLNVTVILASEMSSSELDETGMPGTDTKSQYVRFLSDGVIDIYSSGLGGVSDRAVRVSKMRRTSHLRGPIPMQITDDGMNIIPPKR